MSATLAVRPLVAPRALHNRPASSSSRRRGVVVNESFVSPPENTPPAMTVGRTLPRQRSAVMARASGDNGNQQQRGGEDEPDRDGERPGRGRLWGEWKLDCRGCIYVFFCWHLYTIQPCAASRFCWSGRELKSRNPLDTSNTL